MESTVFSDLAREVAIPADGTLSRTLYQDDRVKMVLFGFASGEELSEHTAAFPAILHVLEGEATVTLDGRTGEAGPGFWVHMPARLPHAVSARTAVKMVLLLLKEPPS